MASPFGKAMSPYTDNSNGLRRFGSEIKSPFQPPSDFSNSFLFGKISQVPDMENQPKNPFQQSRLFGDGGSTSETIKGSSFSGHASTSPFSFGKPSTLFGRPGNQQSHDNPFQQHSSPLGGEVLAWRESPTVGHSSNIFGKASNPAGKASPFVFNTKEQEVKIPFQQSKAFGGGGLASKISQTTTDPSIFGRASTSPFSFGKPSTSNGNKSKNPFKQSTFLAGASLASKSSQEMGGSGSFSSGKPSTFANSSNVHNPEPTNLFQNSTQESNRSPWSQQEKGVSTKSGGSPFRQPACYQNPSSPFTSGSAPQPATPSPFFLPSGNPNIKQWTFPREGSRFFQPSGHGGLPLLENAECMEEDTLISLSATPSYENTSPEELRWKDCQAKQAGGSQISLNVRPSGLFSVPNVCNGDAAPSNRQVFTPNPADHSTPLSKLWNNGTSSAASSAGFNSWSFGSIQSTPITTALPAEAPSSSLSPLPQATPFPGLHNQSQFALKSPFGSSSAAPGLSPGVTSSISSGVTSSISSTSCPMPAASCVQAQSEKAYSLQWPQSSLQAPVLSMPSPLATVTPSPAAASEDQNILPQRDPLTAGGKISYKIAAEMSFKFSNTESGSLVVRHGISSLPDAGCKYSHPRTISLLTSKQVYQKTVLRMQSRRHGSLKKDRPRVSFLNDYSDEEDNAKRDALPVARKNPQEFLLGTPWLDSSAT